MTTGNHFITHFRETLLRGGRMTKYKGQAASSAPSFVGTVCESALDLAGQALGSASRKLACSTSARALGIAMLAALPVGIGATGAQAGACTETGGAGSGIWTCTGAAGADSTQSPTPAAGGALDVTTASGFGIETAAGHAIDLNNAGGDTDITFTDNNAASITGFDSGIFADNYGYGTTSITSTGTVTGGNFYGIFARNGTSAIDLSITANDTSGLLRGIHADNYGYGATTITSTGTAASIGSDAIFARNGTSAGDLSVTANDTSGGVRGIRAINSGTGATTITSTGTAAGAAYAGIFAFTTVTTTDLSITANDTSGAQHGIRATNSGTGATTITSTGTAVGTYSFGIYARNFGTDLSITANDTSGGLRGIHANNYGTGATTITSTGTAIGTGRDGIYARNEIMATDLSITAAGVSGGYYGIYAFNYGSGTTSITSTGTVTGVGFDGIFAMNSGSGTDLTITAAGVSGGLRGIYARNYGSGATSVTASGTVTGGTFDGIYARNENTATDLTITANDTLGGQVGISALNNGAGATTITSNGTAIGTNSFGIYARNYGTDLGITAYDTSGGQFGIRAINDGIGGTTITSTGTAAGTSELGIYAVNGTSASYLSITANNASGGNVGIFALNNGTGATTITSTGTAVGTTYAGIAAFIGPTATDLSITANNATSDYYGIYALSYGTGTTSVTVSGTVTGGTGFGIDVRTYAGSSTTITLNAGAAVSATSGQGISNNAGNSTTVVNTGASVAGSIVLGDGSDNLTFAGGDFSAVTLFDGGDDSGTGDGFTDVLTFAGSSGALAGANVQNWESVVVGAGSVVAFSGTLTTGGLSTNAGGVLNAAGGAFVLNGNLSNAGTVAMLNGATGDSVTVNGDFSGTGTIQVDVDFAGDTSDLLTVNGNVTGGTTLIAVTDVTTGVATGNDVLVVDVTGTTAASDFALAGGPISSGAFMYDLGLSGSQFFLQIDAANATGAVYEAAPGVLLGFGRLATLEQRMGERLQLPGQAFWMRAQGETLNTAPASSTAGITRADSNSYSLQAGVDFPVEGGGNGDLMLGVTAQYGSISASVANASGTGNITSDGYGVGATATWRGTNDFYVDAQAQVNWLNSDLSSSSSGTLVTGQKATSYALSAEVGKRIAVANGGVVIPQTQLLWGQVDGGSFTDADGSAVDLGRNTSTIGRIGMAYEFGSATEGTDFYIVANVLHDFSSPSSVTVAGTPLSSKAETNWGEIGFGGNFSVSDTAMIYGQASYSTALSGNTAANNGLSATAGLRIRW